jgi:hypothetical protein
MVIKLIALKPMAYAGARLKRGDAFEAKHEKDAKLLRAVKLADFPPPAPIMLKKPAVVDVVVTPVAEPTVYEAHGVLSSVVPVDADMPEEAPKRFLSVRLDPVIRGNADAAAPKRKRVYARKDMVADE